MRNDTVMYCREMLKILVIWEGEASRYNKTQCLLKKKTSKLAILP